ncbi:WGR domain [Legionella pneumophila]|jgi:predicted DNA-binding WGR domain protein|uniref:WGR domain-containing protein n=1 Tax=Legionella pneumophila TaxID=446 RepID=UPI0007708358|nr:WGR domain-containing protein [Legionella pneumophila]CZP12988.1 WGR domain [Legionella pneumophila]CZP47159.1 WGR domain [Legionella pneumophila]CZP83676.1 WGR domain [Legionella pneumophila]
MTHGICTLPWFHYLNFKQKKLYHAARFEKETRYYVIRLENDLLGDWIITASNGRIKSKLGQTRTIAFSNFAEAFDHFCIMAKERNQRGYHLITYQSDDVLYQQILFLCSKGKPLPSLIQKNSPVARVKRTRSPINPATKTIQSQFPEIQQMSFAF